MIELHDIEKIYKNGDIKVNALKQLSLSIQEGEMLAIMGTSGSGKSTLLNILGAMDSPTAGEYLFNGEHIEKYNQRKLDLFRKDNISFIFQRYALMNEFSIFENLEMPLENKGIKKKQRKEIIEKNLELLHIADLRNKMPNQLSGGQQQRCAVARALAMDSRVILADEPTGSLDKKNTENIMELFTSINKMGKTIVIITHDQHVAEYCKRIEYLEDGKIV